VTNRVINAKARQEVRKRLQKWDAITAHPDLGTYGDPENREWKQYFLPDENLAASAACPFLSRKSRRGTEL
jgi:FPC/CPF motif-containing protein YcgG